MAQSYKKYEIAPNNNLLYGAILQKYQDYAS
jgi:hypothetical protein